MIFHNLKNPNKEPGNNENSLAVLLQQQAFFDKMMRIGMKEIKFPKQAASEYILLFKHNTSLTTVQYVNLFYRLSECCLRIGRNGEALYWIAYGLHYRQDADKVKADYFNLSILVLIKLATEKLRANRNKLRVLYAGTDEEIIVHLTNITLTCKQRLNCITDMVELEKLINEPGFRSCNVVFMSGEGFNAFEDFIESYHRLQNEKAKRVIFPMVSPTEYPAIIKKYPDINYMIASGDSNFIYAALLMAISNSSESLIKDKAL